MLKYVTGPITKADAGGLDATITTPKVDSDGESVDPLGLKNRDEYLSNPLVYWAHEWALTQGTAEPIGKATRLDVTKSAINSAAVYAPTPKAQNVRALVLGGFVRKTSIGFDPLKMESIKGIPTHTEWALREWSVVPMPANTDATITGVKSALRWFADQLPTEDPLDAPVDDDIREIDGWTYYPPETDTKRLRWVIDADSMQALIKATVADHLNLTTETPNVVQLRDGKRVIATIRRRRVATFPQSS